MDSTLETPDLPQNYINGLPTLVHKYATLPISVQHNYANNAKNTIQPTSLLQKH